MPWNPPEMREKIPSNSLKACCESALNRTISPDLNSNSSITVVRTVDSATDPSDFTMLSFLRPSLPPRTERAGQNPVFYENGRSSLEFRDAGADYSLRNMHPPMVKGEPLSIMVPPHHYHIKQSEHFRIVSGTVNIYRGLDPQPWKILSDRDGFEEAAMIPKKIYHRIENASSTEPLVLDVHLAPEEYEVEQRFFRNFFGYLDDCKSGNVAPSLFQLLVFLHSADTPLALPFSESWPGVFASRIFLIGMAFWGRWILGYKQTYPEYYLEKKDL
ncbi:hypothetical protein PV10_00367 [Exophiala mesophila]|uniref:Cupin 2 conserved barrel domain-containing protein n=1 Tax=Exophiala mesophila TaxID=212818 RepID=A0A0D1ZRG6_EXOME|nr:uncharacterized protein PV10_00367 [Exophiala mesophila]KIV96509.1 hypothetical protein PV10_00367 [Exophiala mesophila]